MQADQTAIILIGYQNDYFAEDGILHEVIEETSRVNNVLANTLDMLEHMAPTEATLISTPIIFTPDYEELVEPIGILATIKEVQAFMLGRRGSETIPEFGPYASRITEVPGKRGLNAFVGTELDALLQERNIKNIVIAGAVTSICVDSTGRSAFERGYRVTILSDCTTGRTPMEQEFYCEKVFPLYAEVLTHHDLLARVEPAGIGL
ncbi:MAG: isochorismatase [Planctomycetes bacterium]|jgi:nicotinamidase-related amidase|nr:isochorismatase [Planctomycetota bacterium]